MTRINTFDVVKLVEKEYGLSPGSVCSKKRTGIYSEARHVTIYLSYTYKIANITELAEYLEKDVHAIAYGRDKVSAALLTCLVLKRSVERVEKELFKIM